VPDPKRLTFQAEVDDNLEIFIDGKSIVQFNQGMRERRFSGKIEENRWYDFLAVYREDSGEAKAILKWEADKLPSQIIPPSRFRTFSGEADETGREGRLSSFPVKGPDGKPRVAQLSSTDGGSVLKLQGQISSGLYQLSVPEEQRPFFSDFVR
jgi:hypothetical protein